MRELLKNKNAVMVWFSRTFSRFGDAFESLALMYLIYELTGSALAMGTIMFFSVIPNIVVTPFAGVFGDRYDKKKIMIVAEMVRTITIAMIPTLHAFGVLKLWHIYVITVVVSIEESFFEPCAQVVIKLVVTKEQLPLYNSAITTSNQIARMIGYTLSGIIMGILSKDILFIIDAITFLCSAITIFYVSFPQRETRKLQKKLEIFTDMYDVARYLLDTKAIIAVIVAILIDGILIIPISEFLPLALGDILHVDDSWAGFYLTVISIGTLIGSIVFPILIKAKFKLKHVVLLGQALVGTFIVIVALKGNLVTGVIVYLALGATTSLITMWCSTEMQNLCEVEFMARTSAVFSMALTIADPLAATISGWLIDLVNIRNIFYCVRILFILTGLMLYVFIGKTMNQVEEVTDVEDIVS